jgi:hypothetical protein
VGGEGLEENAHFADHPNLFGGMENHPDECLTITGTCFGWTKSPKSVQ